MTIQTGDFLMNVVFVSFYTRNSGYEKEVKNLIASCQKLDLPIDIVAIDSEGRWDKNCAYKPRFLLEMLKKHQKPVVWIDADGIVLQKPVLFKTLTCDIGVRILEDLPMDSPSKIISNTIYVNHTQNSHLFLSLWEKKCHKLIQTQKEEVWDQEVFKHVLQKMKTLSVFPLPMEYGHIYDQPLAVNPIIIHYQASRILKHSMYNQSISPKMAAFEESESAKRSLHRSIILKKYGITP